MSQPVGRFEYVETLSLHEQFRLVEIAHETLDSDIRKAALKVLGKYLNPLVYFVPPNDAEKLSTQSDSECPIG
jgi:hypothetical protein